MGSPRVLTDEAKAALAEVQRLRTIQLDTRAKADAEARALVEARTRDADRALGAAVRAAIEARVPKRRVHLEGLSTTDFLTVEHFAAMPEVA